MAKIKSMTSNVGKDMKQLEVLHTAGGSVKWNNYFGTVNGGFSQCHVYLSMKKQFCSYAYTQEE